MTGKKQNILFRCDGSVEIGMGHVVRCLALADALRDNLECNVVFAIRQSELAINAIQNHNYETIISNEENFHYQSWLANCILETNAHILIMDTRDGLKREELVQIKKSTGIKVVTIDDTEDKRIEADLAFYPPVPQVKEMDWKGFKGKLYSDWQYVILRKEFQKKYPKPENPIPNVLVTMGGTDPANMTSFVIDSLQQIEFLFNATIVIGKGYMFKEELSNQLSNVRFDYQLLVNPPDLPEIMSKANLTIIAFGQTAYELAALGIYSTYICLTQDHYRSSQLLEQNEFGKSIGIYNTFSNDYLSKQILRLFLKLNSNSLSINKNERIKISDTKVISSIIEAL